MSYATTLQVQQAAGGSSNLIELTDQEGTSTLNTDVLTQAQQEADNFINLHLRRLHGDILPLDPVPFEIQMLAAHQSVYQLKVYRQIVSDEDRKVRDERIMQLEGMERGMLIPGNDPYPIGDGGGTPSVDDRSSDEDISRESLGTFS